MTTTTAALIPGIWIADPVHSVVSFAVRHMGLGKVRGTMDLTSATLTVGDDGGSGSQVTATIDATSVRTGNDQRDRHVRSSDFLDVERFPLIEFVSSKVRGFDGEEFVLAGDLTVHGITRRVDLACEFHGTVADPSGGARTAFSATTTISRAEFGVDIHLAFGVGGIVVADSVQITIDIAFIQNGVPGQ